MRDYTEFIEKTNRIYNCMADELSKKIYVSRIMNSLTYNYNYIADITKDGFHALDELRKHLEQYMDGKHEFVLDGAGYYGKSIRATMKDIPWLCFSDANPKEKEIMGLQVLKRTEAVKKYPHAVFVVSSLVYAGEIKRELQELNVDRIVDLDSYVGKQEADERQYYDVFDFAEDEVMVDVGCFDCYTTLQYFKYGNTRYKKIYSFEPDPMQYDKCRKIILNGGYDDWEIYNAGIYDKPGNLRFRINGTCTKMDTNGDIEVDVIALDDFFINHEAPTFIKMDIEGAELGALKGAAETIKKYKPKMAICVYHKVEDIFEIPEYILSLNPSYRFYLRHYTNLVHETVLYCE